MKVKQKKHIASRLIVLIAFAALISFAGIANAQSAVTDVVGATVRPVTDVVGGVFDALGIEGGRSTEATSFIEFEGGLEAPSTEGYSPGLTQATTARDFILNVTNFALGFLGLLAVIIVIYGGVLYLTAAGKEERADKGKKSIMYAIIGLLLIMGSYALVNTILQAPSGVESGELAGSAPTDVTGISGDQIAQRRAQFYHASTQIRTIAENFYTGYLHYTEVKNQIGSLHSRYPAEGTLLTHQQYRDFMEGEINKVNRIRNVAKPLDELYTAVDEAVAIYQQKINNSAAQYNKAVQSGSVTLGTSGVSTPLLPGIDEITVAPVVQVQDANAIWRDYMSDELNDTEALGEPYTILNTANEEDFARITLQAKAGLTELQESIRELTDTEIGIGVDEAFEALIGSNGDLTTLAREDADNTGTPILSKPGITNTEIVRILERMAVLSKAVENIQFVAAIITTNTVEGSAPLIVNFDGLRSLDPANVSIPSGNFSWDFGDGTTSPATGVSVTHVYEEVGAYIAKLTVDSPNSDKVAAGVAYVRITVREPAVKFDFKAQVGEEIYELRKYDPQTGRLLTEINTLKLTSAEAESGVTFSVGEVSGADLQSIKWNFGNLRPEIVGPEVTAELIQEVTFPEEGNYQILFEAVDRRNNSSRKIVNVVIGSPNARIQVLPGTIGDINTEFTFDGGNSRSDAGRVSNFEWTYPDATELISVTDTDEILKLRFIKPSYGVPHKVSLKVTDNLGKTDTSTVNIKIESRPPVAQFFVIHEEPKEPGLVLLDASDSYDPDGDDIKTYTWTVDGQDIEGKPMNPNVAVDAGASASDRNYMLLEFLATGEYKVALKVTDSSSLESEIAERIVDIEDVLDIRWAPADNVTAQLNESGEATISLNLSSRHAQAYEIDWGDGVVDTGSMNVTTESYRGVGVTSVGLKQVSIPHTYTEAKTYNVKASVFDELDNENSTTRKIFIGAANAPIAVIGGAVGTNPIINSANGIEVARTDIVRFDANQSKNVDGTGRRLRYTWDFGDGTRSTQREASHTFRETGEYAVTLTVSDESGRTTATSQDTIKVTAAGLPPTLRGLSVVPATTNLVTPVQVNLTAIGASDPDGRITRYRWYYYDVADKENILGTQITTMPNATMTIGTKGNENDPVTYEFVVEVTDDENQTTSSKDRLAFSPTLTVVNGPNKPPTASFTVDRTSIMVGESINFISSSTDPDGNIVKYYWDFEGDGFANNNEILSANESHTYTSPAREGLAVRLKVEDDKGSVAYSNPVTIYVDAPLLPPRAAFTSAQQGTETTVQFTDNSSVDPGAGAGVTINKWEWDFDVNVDSDGDGRRDNDVQSTAQNPTYDYVEYGIKRAKLTVTDSAGNSASVTNFVNVKEPVTAPVSTQPVGARLLTTPSSNVVDGKIHLKGTSGNVTFDYSTSVGNIKRYVIDKNVYFDSNGSGRTNDDEDHVSTAPGSWTTDFDSSWGNIRVRLTVFDEAGRSNFVEKDIVFDASANSSLVANTFGSDAKNIPAVLVTLLGFAILTLSILRFKNQKINDK